MATRKLRKVSKINKPKEDSIEKRWDAHFDGVQSRLHAALWAAADAVSDYQSDLEEFKESLTSAEAKSHVNRLELMEENLHELDNLIEGEGIGNNCANLADLVAFSWLDDEEPLG